MLTARVGKGDFMSTEIRSAIDFYERHPISSEIILAKLNGGAAVPWPHYAGQQEGVQRLTSRPAIVL
jgi:hypothetical protein